MRRDKCKCGRFITWEDGYDAPKEIICKFCNTKYKVESDDVTVWWLEERISSPTPWTTERR
jgi:hypothetical protein